MSDEVEETVIRDPKAVLNALDEAKKEAKKYREERDALQSKVDADPYKDRAVKAEAKLALLQQGIKDPDRLVKYMKLDDVTFDEDGKLEGFEKSLKMVREDFPELFDTKRRVGGRVDIHAKGDAIEKTATEQQVDRLLAK